LVDFKKTLMDISFDDANKEYLSNSKLEVIHFDYLTEKHIAGLGCSEKISSTDALFCCNLKNENYLIEFKNGKIARDEKENKAIKKNLAAKIVYSLLTYMQLFKKDLSHVKEHLIYILVYNEEKNKANQKTRTSVSESLNSHKFWMEDRAKIGIAGIKANLNDFEKLYFKKVYTITETEFQTQFVDIWENTSFCTLQVSCAD